MGLLRPSPAPVEHLSVVFLGYLPETLGDDSILVFALADERRLLFSVNKPADCLSVKSILEADFAIGVGEVEDESVTGDICRAGDIKKVTHNHRVRKNFRLGDVVVENLDVFCLAGNKIEKFLHFGDVFGISFHFLLPLYPWWSGLKKFYK